MPEMSTANKPEWERNLDQVFDDLGARERRFGDYLLRERERVATKAIAALATEAQVSEATVVRLCHKMGYTGLKELKQVLGRERSRSVMRFAAQSPEEAMIERLKQQVFEGSIQSLQDTLLLVDNDVLLHAVRVLCRANRIRVYALGGSVPVARSFKHQMMKLGISVNLNSELQRSMIAVEKYTPQDLAIAVTHSGETESVVQALQSARSKGATTICITSNADSAVASCTDIKLIARGVLLLDGGDNSLARIAQTSIVNLLYVGVANLYTKYNP